MNFASSKHQKTPGHEVGTIPSRIIPLTGVGWEGLYPSLLMPLDKEKNQAMTAVIMLAGIPVKQELSTFSYWE